MNRSGQLVSTLLKSYNGQMSTVRHSHGLPPIGKKQLEQLRNFIPSLLGFGAVGGAALLYFTDWRAVTEYIPFYRGKYHDDDE